MSPLIAALILAYNGLACFPMPDHCAPTFCEEAQPMLDGSLYCEDTDETYPAGHWTTDIGPDYGDVQYTVEY
jgi:hypothetical protein